MDILEKIIDKKMRLMLHDNKVATVVYLGGKEIHELLRIERDEASTPQFISAERMVVVGLRVFKVNASTHLEVL